MEHDYYAILGIPQSADIDTIRKAYRKRAMECHPDRGGSHAQMTLVNEAWEVLSQPELRENYDRARSHRHDAAAQHAAEDVVRQARQRAGDYPRRWEEFERWLSVVTADFTDAKYGSFRVTDRTTFPTAENSFTGCLFIFIGAAVAAILAVYAIGIHAGGGHFGVAIRGIFLFVSFVAGGAWVGAKIHKWLGTGISQLQGVPNRNRVVQCDKCGQKLRVPIVQSELVVTCKSCGHRFPCMPQ